MQLLRSFSMVLLAASMANARRRLLSAEDVATGVSIFNKYASMAGQALNEGTTSTAGATSTASKSPFNSLVTGVQNGAQIGSDLQSCYTSVDGKGADIASAYDAASSSFADPSSLGSAGNAAQMLFSAYMSNAADSDTLWKLYQIYANKKTSGLTANDAQNAAYQLLTPQCNKAFGEIDSAYANAQSGAAQFLTSTDGGNTTCYAYGQTTDEGYNVRFRLCVNPSKIQPQGNGLAENITGNFTNYGVSICNLTFYVKDLENAYSSSPSWLPDSEKKYPNGFPADISEKFSAVVPYNKLTYDPDAALIDIKKGWFACPYGKNTPPPTPARTSKPTSAAVVADTILAGQDACFLTTACKNTVSNYVGDDCLAYNKLFTSGCHSCPATTVKAAKDACMVGCTDKQCVYTPTAATTQSSGAATLRLSFVALATGLAVAIANYVM